MVTLTVMLCLLVASSDALRVDAPKPVMKLRGGVTGIDPTILAKCAPKPEPCPTASHQLSCE